MPVYICASFQYGIYNFEYFFFLVLQMFMSNDRQKSIMSEAFGIEERSSNSIFNYEFAQLCKYLQRLNKVQLPHVRVSTISRLAPITGV